VRESVVLSRACLQRSTFPLRISLRGKGSGQLDEMLGVKNKGLEELKRGRDETGKCKDLNNSERREGVLNLPQAINLGKLQWKKTRWKKKKIEEMDRFRKSFCLRHQRRARKGE